ncbi:MAG: hypothetical protein ACP5O6_03055 [Candidatus Baltobacteraceae bacterium]
MSSMIDTLAISKRLKKAGDSPEHAEAVAEFFGMVFQENVVTKSDLRDACEKLDKKIDTVAANLDKKIDSVAATLDGKIQGLDGRLLALEQRGEALASRHESRLSRAVLTLFVGLTGVISLATSLLMTHIK